MQTDVESAEKRCEKMRKAKKKKQQQQHLVHVNLGIYIYWKLQRRKNSFKKTHTYIHEKRGGAGCVATRRRRRRKVRNASDRIAS